jgi:DNA-binding transcriptional MerR regulator/quercetin dioxygenase-like cupin family protein
VSQAARLVGVSASTLRLWERNGLIAPARRNGRNRLYSPELMKTLKQIKHLRDVRHLNVPAIKEAMGGPSAPADAPQETPTIGPTLRRLRQRFGLSVGEAARRAHVSAGFLSAVERTQANASVTTLTRLATAYNTTLLELFHLPRQASRLVRPHHRRILQTKGGVRMELLSTGTKLLESMLFRVAPGGGSDGAYAHPGEEFIYMLSGTLELWLDEVEYYVLRPGDGCWFESTLAHRWLNASKEEAVLLWINTPPTF